LFNLYYDYLIAEGVKKENIIKLSLDNDENENLLNSKVLGAYIRERIVS